MSHPLHRLQPHLWDVNGKYLGSQQATHPCHSRPSPKPTAIGIDEAATALASFFGGCVLRDLDDVELSWLKGGRATDRHDSEPDQA